MIYFINKPGFVKIGYSKHPSRRLKQFQTANADLLELLCEIEGTKKLEKKLHKLFWRNRCRDDSEWFVLSTGLLMYIKRLQENNGYLEPNQIELFFVPVCKM